MLVPYRGRWEKLSAGQQAVNRSHAKIRALGEQAMATLKTWRLLRMRADDGHARRGFKTSVPPVKAQVAGPTQRAHCVPIACPDDFGAVGRG